MARTGDLDLAIVTNCGEGPVEVVRQEPLLWVASSQHGVEDEDVLPLALSKPPCIWRTAAFDVAVGVGRKYRVLYTSGNSTAISAAVLAGLAVTVLAESALRPGMRVLERGRGLPAAADLRDRHRPLLAPADLGDRRQARRAHRLVARQPLGARGRRLSDATGRSFPEGPCKTSPPPTDGPLTLEELQLAARNHGMPLEALRYDVTPVGLHYLLVHFDIPVVDASTWRLRDRRATSSGRSRSRWTTSARARAHRCR